MDNLELDETLHTQLSDARIEGMSTTDEALAALFAAQAKDHLMDGLRDDTIAKLLEIRRRLNHAFGAML